jgi:hypothetical protein
LFRLVFSNFTPFLQQKWKSRTRRGKGGPMAAQSVLRSPSRFAWRRRPPSLAAMAGGPPRRRCPAGLIPAGTGGGAPLPRPPRRPSSARSSPRRRRMPPAAAASPPASDAEPSRRWPHNMVSATGSGPPPPQPHLCGGVAVGRRVEGHRGPGSRAVC